MTKKKPEERWTFKKYKYALAFWRQHRNVGLTAPNWDGEFWVVEVKHG